MIEIIGFYFDELLGIFDWSSRSAKERWQTVGAWALVVIVSILGFVLFSSPDDAAVTG